MRSSKARPWALVTGGSRGIGRAVAEHLAGNGWNLSIAYLRNHEAANSVAQAVENLGARCVVAECNVADQEACSALVDETARAAGTLQGLVHAAGLGALKPVLDTRPNRFRLTWDSHVGGLLHLLSAGASLLAGGSVVALTSLGARRVMPGYGSIAATKSALESVVRYLAVELAPLDINVNAVCGGPVDTDSLRSFETYDTVKRMSASSVAGRLGTPQDIAPIVGFLLEPASRWIRGQIVVADGGLGLH